MPEKIVYFYLLEGKNLLGRKSTTPQWDRKKTEEMELIICGIPEFHKRTLWGKRKDWDRIAFQDYIGELSVSVCSHHSYLSDEWKEKMGIVDSEAPMLSALLVSFLKKYRGVSELLVIDGIKEDSQPEDYYEDIFTAEEIRPFLSGLKGMHILTEKEEDFVGLEAWMWEEYGMPIQFFSEVTVLKSMSSSTDKDRILILDMARDFYVKNSLIRAFCRGRECIYTDVCSVDRKKKNYTGMGRRFHYVSEKQYLDRTFLTLQGKMSIIR